MSEELNKKLYKQIALMSTDLELLTDKPKYEIVSLLLNYYTIPNPMTFKDIGIVWGISNQRAAALVGRSIKKLKQPHVAVCLLRSVSKEQYELLVPT